MLKFSNNNECIKIPFDWRFQHFQLNKKKYPLNSFALCWNRSLSFNLNIYMSQFLPFKINFVGWTNLKISRWDCSTQTTLIKNEIAICLLILTLLRVLCPSLSVLFSFIIYSIYFHLSKVGRRDGGGFIYWTHWSVTFHLILWLTFLWCTNHVSEGRASWELWWKK